MKKTLLFLPFVALLLVAGCTEEVVVGKENPLAADYESIMDGERVWRISKVESDKPRNYVYTYFKNTDDFIGYDTVRVKGTDWLSQMEEVANAYEDFPFEGLVRFDFNAYNGIYLADLILDTKSPKAEDFSTVDIGESIEPGDYSTFNIDPGKSHELFYGYIISGKEWDDHEVWNNFSASPSRISYQVEKVYNDTTYLVNVELTPAE
jgi:hypothetical protein